MEYLVKLFKLIEITRSQPQYGYALAAIPKGELSDLAQHHYIVAFIAWQLARNLKTKGANISVEKVLEFALIHDLGELFGGDIAMPYAKANPAARKLAKAFEAENQNYISNFFGADAGHFKALSAEIMDANSDEALIAKFADYIEVTHYKQYLGKLSSGDVTMAAQALREKINKLKDEAAKKEMFDFCLQWERAMSDPANGQEFFEAAKL